MAARAVLVNGIRTGDVVVCVPDSQNNCPHDHSGPDWIVDDTQVGKLFRVDAVRTRDDVSCTLLHFRDEPNPDIDWCAGSFRRVEPGKIPDPSNVRELEPA